MASPIKWGWLRMGMLAQLLSAISVEAQSFTIGAFTVDSGGGKAVGGGLS